jgi:acyl-CoA synthetase (AMP-forming)/AMP-acid ligase II
MIDAYERTGVPFVLALARHGDRPAFLLHDGGVLSYEALDAEIEAFTERHLDPSIGVLAIAAETELPGIVAYLAALRMGIPVLMHPAGLAGAEMAHHFAADATYRRDGTHWRWDDRARGPVGHRDLALLLGTSGTTGSSKLVRLSAANLQSNAEAIASYLALTSNDVGITTLPLSYSYGLSVLHSHLAAGAALSLYQGSVTDAGFAQRLARDGVTGMAGVPFTFDLLERAGIIRHLPPSVRYMTQAGGRLDPSTITRIHHLLAARGTDLFVMYGQTEATARISYLPPARLPELADTIGQAVPGGRLRCLDELGSACPPGVEGELAYDGPNVMMGYAEERQDLSRGPEVDTLLTGDLGIEGPPGIFRITGRTKRIVKPFGLRISLDDLERRLRDAGVPAFVAGNDEAIVVALTSSAGLDIARAALADLHIDPSVLSYRVYDEIPRLPNGKVAYGTILSNAVADRDLSIMPEGLLAIEELYARIGKKRVVEDDDTFSSLGGDSLSYVHASLAIEDALGEPVEHWETLTFGEIKRRAMATAMTDVPGARSARWVDTDIVLRAAAILMVTIQHARGGWMGGSDMLMLLAGYNFSRFRRDALANAEAGSVFASFFRNYIALYMGIMLLYFLAKQKVLWSHLLFVSTFNADWGGSLNIYWFFETLSWAVLFLCLLHAIPAVRRFAAAQPLTSSLAFVGLALVLRLIGSVVTDPASTAMRTVDQMLLLFAAGWTIAIAPRVIRLVTGSLCVVASALAWGIHDSHALSMLIAVFALTFIARVPLPDKLAKAVYLIAAASFYIYLLNVVPMYLVDEVLNAAHGRFWPLHLAMGLMLGITAYFGANLMRTMWWTHRHRFSGEMLLAVMKKHLVPHRSDTPAA